LYFNPRFWAAGAASLGLAACATTTPGADAPDAPDAARAAFASTYVAPEAAPTLIRGGTILDGEGEEFSGADLLLENGKVSAIGPNLTAPAGAVVIDATGKFVTPGVIDAHSHLGVYPSPGIQANSDGNELTRPNTADIWAEHSIWPMDPGFERALQAGVTTLHVLPGSGNLFGGRGVTVHPVLSARTAQEMKYPDAPQSLKMACGENPSRVYGERNSSPATDMGNVAGYREAFIEAQAYQREWAEYRENDDPDAEPPTRDLGKETLAGVLDGEILVQWHCYRADQMAVALEIAREFDFEISAFHHAVEAYKIPELLAEHEVCAAMWADWWGFKIEAYDGIRENIAFVDAAGACAIVHSDSEMGIQRLNQEAAKAMADGRRAGLEISRAHAFRWLSLNPARALGIDDRTGSLSAGKAADVVIWSADPFSSYALAERVFIDGALAFDRAHAPDDPASDFELGQTFEERAR